MHIIKTPIEDLTVILNKVIGDARGFLAEMAPGGSQNEFLSKGFGNLYASVATGKHVARAGHYHFKSWENHYTLTGTAFWLFTDFRQGSPTLGQSVEIIAGAKAWPNAPQGAMHYTLDQQVMAQVYCGPGINHVVWPLTDEPVVIVDATSEPYTKEDYSYPKIEEIPGIEDILKKYGIKLKT